MSVCVTVFLLRSRHSLDVCVLVGNGVHKKRREREKQFVFDFVREKLGL